jgi:hypothetical protein
VGQEPVVGQRAKGLGGPRADVPPALEALGGLGGVFSLVQEAAEQGNLRISTNFEVHNLDPQGTNAEGAALHEEISEIMRRHGIDPDSGEVGSVDPRTMAEARREVEELLARRAADLGDGKAAG